MYFPKPAINENDLAIIERGDTAEHSISAGQYVSWKGKLGKAVSAILQGATLDDSLFSYETDGVINSLNNNFVKVWENQNISASFAAQTLSIDLSAYRFILIVTSDGTGWVEVGILTRNTLVVGGSASNIRGRDFRATTTSVICGDGYGGSTKDNTNCIPQRIYGVK